MKISKHLIVLLIAVTILWGVASPVNATNGTYICPGNNVYSVSGTKFLDDNGNGIQDRGERGINCVAIKLYDARNRLVAQTKTGLTGYYSFDRLAAGTYTVKEVVPDGYVSTTGASKTVCLSSKAKKATANFGNAKPATIVGLKYNDLNKNKKYDKGEPGLAGWTIRLKNAKGTTATTTTDSKGGFKFANLAPGTYVISEVLQPGYTNTGVTSLKISVISGQVLNVTTKYGLFGNVPVTPPVQLLGYVANRNDNTVSVLNVVTDTVLKTIPVGDQPWDVAFTPDGTRVYVTNDGSSGAQGVSVIDTASETVVATVDVGAFPTGVAVTPDGAKAYVVNQGDSSVSVINTATNTVSATITTGIGYSPSEVAISPDGKHAYVTDENPDLANPIPLESRVTIIDTATDSVVTSIPLGSTLVQGIAITPDGTRAYVANWGDTVTIPPSVVVVDLTTNSVLKTIILDPFTGPKNIAITPDGTQAYVTLYLASAFSVINTGTNSVIATTTVGPNPNDVAITPDGKLAYATIGTDNTVVTIDTATNAVTRTPVTVGQQPQGIAISPIS